MNNHILTEGRNFKIFLKENYSVAFYSNNLYIFTENVEDAFEYDDDSTYGVCVY